MLFSRRRITLLIVSLLLPHSGMAAISSVGSFLVDADKNEVDPYAPTADSQLDSGNLGVCIVAIDDDGDDTDGNDFDGVTDAAGNTWTVVGENTSDNGGAGSGAAVMIAFTVADSNLGAGSAITFDLGSAREAKAATCWEFTTGGAMEQSGTEQKEDVTSGGGGDTGALTISGLASSEHIWVRGVASETDAEEITAYTSGWTNFTETGTTGKAGHSNMRAAGEFIIETATTNTSDPTSGTGVDRASSMIALSESGGGGGGAAPWTRRRVITTMEE